MDERKALFAVTTPLPQYCIQKYSCTKLATELTMQDGHSMTTYHCEGNAGNCPWVDDYIKADIVPVGGILHIRDSDRYLCRNCASTQHPTSRCPE